MEHRSQPLVNDSALLLPSFSSAFLNHAFFTGGTASYYTLALTFCQVCRAKLQTPVIIFVLISVNGLIQKLLLKVFPYVSLALCFDRMEFPFLRARRQQMGEGGGSKQTEKYCTRLMLNLSTEQDFFTTLLKKNKVAASLFKKSTRAIEQHSVFFILRYSEFTQEESCLTVNLSTLYYRD